MMFEGQVLALIGTVISGGTLGAILTFITMNRKHRRDDFSVLLDALRVDNDELRKRIGEAQQNIIELHKERGDLLERLAKMEAKIILLQAQIPKDV
jgi:predicted  nucleic acid-binding Zn-ribbon protein